MTEERFRKEIEEFIKLLARTLQACKMYGTGHKISSGSINDCFNYLGQLLAEEQEITIGIIGNEIAYEKQPFYETSKRAYGFIDHLKAIDLKKISFARGLEESELKELMELLLLNPSTLQEEDSLKKIFKTTNIEHIAIGDIGYKSGQKAENDGEGSGGGDPNVDYQEGMDFLAEAYEDLKGNQPLDADAARQIVSNMISDIVKNKNLLLLLTSTKSHDESTLLHGVNVAVFSLMQAEALGLSKKHLQDIGVAALLHDSGKITTGHEEVDEEQDIEKMSAVERKKRAMQNINGAKILLDMKDISVLAALAAFEHDVSYEGKGVPDRLYGDKPNLASMMIAISSYYDKLRTREDAKKDGGTERVFEKMMELSGKKFHPDLLSNFFTLVGVFPPGTLVELNTGEVGLVIQTSTLDIRRPQVEVLYDKNGEKYADPEIRNLLEKNKKGEFLWSIVKSIAPDDQFEVPEKYA